MSVEGLLYMDIEGYCGWGRPHMDVDGLGSVWKGPGTDLEGLGWHGGSRVDEENLGLGS